MHHELLNEYSMLGLFKKFYHIYHKFYHLQLSQTSRHKHTNIHTPAKPRPWQAGEQAPHSPTSPTKVPSHYNHEHSTLDVIRSHQAHLNAEQAGEQVLLPLQIHQVRQEEDNDSPHAPIITAKLESTHDQLAQFLP